MQPVEVRRRVTQVNNKMVFIFGFAFGRKLRDPLEQLYEVLPDQQ
jgi:hypothetical protein